MNFTDGDAFASSLHGKLVSGYGQVAYVTAWKEHPGGALVPVLMTNGADGLDRHTTTRTHIDALAAEANRMLAHSSADIFGVQFRVYDISLKQSHTRAFLWRAADGRLVPLTAVAARQVMRIVPARLSVATLDFGDAWSLKGARAL